MNFILTDEDINLIGKSLVELPFKEVSSLIMKLNQQLIENKKPKEVVTN